MSQNALAREIEEVADKRGCSPRDLFQQLLAAEEKEEASSSASVLAQPENLLDHIRETVLLLDADNTLLYANCRPEEVLGIDLRNRIGEPFQDVLAGGALDHIDKAPLLKGISRIRNGDIEEERVEVTVPVEPGSEMYLEVRITPFGPESNRVVLVARNVTGRAKMEGQLREREARLRGLANSIPGVVYQFFAQPNGEYGTYFVSEHAEDVLGISADEEGFYERFLDHIPSDHREDLLASIDEAVEHERPWNEKIPFIKPSGERIWIQGLSTPTRRDGVLVFNGVLLDISKRTEYQQQLIEAKKEAETASRMKTALLENMSHELRTPLTAVLGFADLLIDELDEPLLEFAQSIQKGGQRLNDTLETILDLAQLEGQELDLQPQPVDAATTIRQAALAHQADANRKGLHLKTEGLSSEVPSETDPRVLTRITTHLVSNAVKFTEEGSVTVRLETPDEELVLEVDDTGIGLSEKSKEQVFKPFYQVSSGSTRAYEGTGLGLTIVRRLVDMVGGHIKLESQPSSGTTITVNMPRHLSDQATEDSTLRSHDQNEGNEVNTNQHVLLVEDDVAMQELVRQMLPSHLVLDMASDPESARSYIQEGGYDLVLMDINLQAEENGVDLFHYIQDQSGSSRPPVVALTAYAMPGDAESFLEEGFDEYMSKPFNRESLREVITELLDG